jgi:hypothetical protein
MFRQLTISLLALGMISTIARTWVYKENAPRESITTSTTKALVAFDELHAARLRSVQLTCERELHLRMAAIRDKSIEDLRNPSKSLLEVSLVLHDKFREIYPRYFSFLQETIKGQSDLENVAGYLVKHIQYRASLNDAEGFTIERACQLEEELNTTSFQLACKIAKHDKPQN